MDKRLSQIKKIQEAKRLINLNEDSRQYFYEKADETWLKWLWENGFFDVLKMKTEDSQRFSSRIPELHYLARMANLNPELVAEIILNTPISEETFNPEVVDQFLHICSLLPGQQLRKLVGKIKSENWPKLMQDFNLWDMGYGKMFESLKGSGYPEEMMILAGSVFELRDDWEEKCKEEYFDATPFCLHHLSYSKVFHFLRNIEDKYIENAIDLTLSILQRLTIKNDGNQERTFAFTCKDRYPLYEVDIFTIDLRSEYHGSGENDVREIVALLKNLIDRFLTNHCKERALTFYEHYIDLLPDSWLIWRIRLFILSLCPSEFMSQLEEAIFRIFKEKQYSELIMGAEYLSTLKKVFPLMSRENQEIFINNAKRLFSKVDKDEKSFKKTEGSRIFSVIGDSVPKERINELEDLGFVINPEYVPVPMIQMGEVGFVNARGPISQEKLGKMPVVAIIDNLRGIWSPTKLFEQDVQRDFLNPLNAEGMGKLLKEDVKARIQEYLNHAKEFLIPENVDRHYLYSLLLGFTDAINENIETLREIDWQELIAFCAQLINHEKQQPASQLEYEREENDTWLAGWTAVNDAITGLLKKVLGENGKKLGFKWELHRKTILLIIKYWFDYPDPSPDNEQIESAKMTETTGDQKSLVSDPFTLAINSIRGQAFELFMQAVELDFEIKNSTKDGLSADLKDLYEYLLNKENTRAIMFMFGHSLPFFFFRDKNLVKHNLGKIFPADENKKYLYLAAWEGYISNDLCIDIFIDEEIQNLYKKAIVLVEKDYPQQKHFTNPDEGLARHIALAYLVTDLNFGYDLFDTFWANGCLTQHIAFVEILGRGFISSENPKVLKTISEFKNAKEKIKKIWEKLLNDYSDPNVFKGIGFWIDLSKGIYNAQELSSFLARTLVKTDGYLEWENGLQQNIVELAKNSPENTIEIARLYLLEGSVRKKLNPPSFSLDSNWVDAIEILYNHASTKQATIKLINELIGEGKRYFWGLKKVMTDNSP